MKPKPPRGVELDRSGNVVARSSKTGPVITKHLYEKSAQYHALLQYFDEAAKLFGFAPHVEDKTVLMRVAQFWWRQTHQHTDSDGEALDKYMAYLEDKPLVFRETSKVEPDALVNMMGARWCDQGFPVITMGEKYCAALIATEVPPEMVEEIEAPWKCFMIEIPGTEMLQVWDSDEMKSVRITRLLVQRHFAPKTTLPHEPVAEPNWQWRWIAFSETNQHIWRGALAREILQPISFREHELHQYYDPEREEAFLEQVKHDERLYVALGRLALNVCLALSDPDNVKEVGSSHARYKAAGRDPRTGPPEQRVYQLGKPIKVDCRHAVQNWLEGTRASSTVNVQFLVRGHWRNQAHGPKHSLRRRQWIEPFWKGEKDAPIPLRTHKLEGDPQ